MSNENAKRTAMQQPLSERLATRSIVETLHRDIAVAAYYRAKARQFSPGRELEDWLRAEQEVTSASDSQA